MKPLKPLSLLLLILLVSCTANSSASNNTITSNPNNKDADYVKNLRENIVGDYQNAGFSQALLKIDLKSQLQLIEDEDLINAGKLSCKVLDNLTPEDDKYNPITMRPIAKDSKHPYVYTKIFDDMKGKFKFNPQDLDYKSLNNDDQLTFLGHVPHFITNNILNNSIKYYCPEKISYR
ncbi:hypothetical protein FD724_34210 (plasmid) [Nostoc sp. C057]|uniref:hypothetical protein n=1 Tax=Nostoc sp. C057 TaxID=2576903 RepID=UPI0015C3570D|nr:hypothetical protein [Nostoc sp. C057]QLE53009.1 hypothetical protein FD724_34210 [Nostoc sp. C057]